LEDTLKFEIWLAEISSPKELRRNESELYNPVVLSDMESINGKKGKIDDFLLSYRSLMANILHTFALSNLIQVNHHHGMILLTQLSMMDNKRESILDQRMRYKQINLV